MRLPIVGVMGSGEDEHLDLAVGLGRWLASAGAHLLTGGGGGVMAAVSRAFAEVPNRRGLVIGVLPCRPGDRPSQPREGYPNEWVEIAIATHLPLSGARGAEPMSRNHINVLSCDALVALPGGAGTASEVALAVRYQRPLIAYLGAAGSIPGLPDAVPVARTLEGVQDFLRTRLDLNG